MPRHKRRRSQPDPKTVAGGPQTKGQNANSHNFAVRAPMAKSKPMSRTRDKERNKGTKRLKQEDENLSCNVIFAGCVCVFVRSEWRQYACRWRRQNSARRGSRPCESTDADPEWMRRIVLGDHRGLAPNDNAEENKTFGQTDRRGVVER